MNDRNFISLYVAKYRSEYVILKNWRKWDIFLKTIVIYLIWFTIMYCVVVRYRMEEQIEYSLTLSCGLHYFGERKKWKILQFSRWWISCFWEKSDYWQLDM